MKKKQVCRVGRCRCADASTQCVGLERAGQQNLRRHRERQPDVDVTAADERRRLRLLEDDARDAQKDGHDGNAHTESGSQHGTSHGMRGERSECEPADHVTRSLSI
jgi:hypothetical protein